MSVLLGPADGLPLLGQIAKGFHPFVRGSLLPPPIQNIYSFIGSHAEDAVYRVIAPALRHCKIPGGLYPHVVQGRGLVVVLDPFTLKVEASFW